MNKKSKKPFVLVAAIVALLLVIGYGAYAYMNKTWPFAAGNESTTTASVEITKLEAKDDVLNVGVNVTGAKDGGHCVLMIAGKKTGLKIDDTETKKNWKGDDAFKDCLGWSVGVKDFPAGKYTVEVQYVDGDKTVSAKDEVTIQ